MLDFIFRDTHILFLAALGCVVWHCVFVRSFFPLGAFLATLALGGSLLLLSLLVFGRNDILSVAPLILVALCLIYAGFLYIGFRSRFGRPLAGRDDTLDPVEENNRKNR